MTFFNSTRFRSVGRQLLQVDSLPSWAGQEGFDRLAAVDGVAIPDEQQPHRDVGGQVLEEAGRILAPEGTVLHSSGQPALGGNAANPREMVPAEGRPEPRSPALGRIGLDDQRQQVAAGLVYEDDGPAFLLGLFFKAGQRSSFQRRIASSSRWLARLRGFWRLQSYCLRIRPTWQGWYWTPKWRRITWATLGWVQTSPRKPKACGPWAKSSSSWSHCWWVNLARRGFAVAQGLGSLDPGPAEPLADGPFGHAQGFGDAVLGPAFLEQLPSPQAASFSPVGCLLGT